MEIHDDDPDIALVEYFAKKYNMRVTLYDACEVRLAFERGQTLEGQRTH